MSLLNLSRLESGERVQHQLRVVDLAEKRTSNGDPFFIVTLGNSCSQIDSGPVWSDRIAENWLEGVVRGVVVQAIGNIGLYGSRRQLVLSAPLHVLPRDHLRLEDFLPSIDRDPTSYWDMLDRFRSLILSPTIRRVVDVFFADDDFRARFERAPASVGGHHCRLGGLLEHVTEVTAIARQTARAMRANADLAVAGALLHDIGKTEAYSISWEGFARTRAGHLMEHVVLGCLMLDRKLRQLGEPVCSDEQSLELQHLILSHHGLLEFGSPVRPLTLEAEILHWADEASAKTASFRDAMADDAAFPDDAEFGDKSKLWRVDRRALWRKKHDWG
ncbi:MAG: HD domain-containing protein [Anaerolineae bacterium]|nr:HD domain-containing protein [Gemmatimonadaceae bacterium]